MAKEDFLEVFKPYYDSFMTDYKGILSIPSVLDEYRENDPLIPFGKGCKDALDFMLNLAKRDGFKTVNVDNYCGFLEYGEGDKVLLILCHLDVVPATGKWTNPPFEPTIIDDKIYARGSLDDKGPLMACYYALKMLKDSGYVPNMTVRFFFGLDEESGSRCLERYIEKYGECDYGFSPDADFPCIYAEKGISGEKFTGTTKESNLVSFKAGTASNVVPDYAEAVIKDMNLEKEYKEYMDSLNMKYEVKGDTYIAYGKAAHGSTPEIGVNAPLYLAKFLAKYIDNEFLDLCGNYLVNDLYGDVTGINQKDDEMGQVSCNHSIFSFESGKYTIVSNIRYPKEYDFEAKMKVLEGFLSKFGASLEVLSNSPCHYVKKDSHLIKSLLKAYRDYTDDLTEPISIGGGTYARDFKNAVAYGICFPGQPQDMHMPDEYAIIPLLIKGAFIYKDAIKNLCD